jgi:ribosome-associated protein
MNHDADSSLDPSLDLYVKAALGRKAIGLVILDVRELTSVADVFMVCSGRSNRQVTAIADYILTNLKKHGLKPLSVEGKKEGHWVLMDYGHVVIHIFYESIRSFYDLEGLWNDAKRIKTESLIEYERISQEDTELQERINDK